MQGEEFIEALNSYYKLKERYEDKCNRDKLKIINNPLYSLKEKQQKFRLLKKQCINCKKDGGSIFTNENNKLKVVCGHIKDPCKLNIELDKGLYKNSEDLADDLNKIINEKKTEMIKIKLNFLFGYISESDSLVEFNHLKEEIKKKDENYRKVEVFYLNIVNNKYKKDLIEETKKNLYINIQKIKDICKIYNINNNKLLIKNVVELYIGDILPLVTTISELEYVYRNIAKINDENILIEKPYTINDLEYPLKESKIIFNKK